MSVPKNALAASAALLAALTLATSEGFALDLEVVQELAPMSSDAAREVIFEMPPMRPVKRAGSPSQQPAASAAEKGASPALAKEAPAPAPVAQISSKSAEPPAEIAAAPKPAEAQLRPTLPAAPDQPAAQSAPAEAPAAVAAAPTVIPPAPIQSPVIALSGGRDNPVDFAAPANNFGADVIALQGGSEPPKLVPALQSTESGAQAPAGESPAQVAAAPEAQAPAAQVSAESENADARIASLLAQGVVGPAEVRIGDHATLWLMADRMFIPADAARKLASEAGLTWREGVRGLVAPAGGSLDWLAPVELYDDGYVKSDDADALKPEKLLGAFAASLPQVNARRASAGEVPVAVEGWLAPPALSAKHGLSACMNLTSPGPQNAPDAFFNCEAWALGRHGAIKIALTEGGAQAARLKEEARLLADAIVFDHGAQYEEFNAASDKVAPYTASDLLIREVAAPRPAAQPPEPPAVPAAEVENSVSGSWLGLLALALTAIAGALGFLIWKKRQSAAPGQFEARGRGRHGHGAQADRFRRWRRPSLEISPLPGRQGGAEGPARIGDSGRPDRRAQERRRKNARQDRGAGFARCSECLARHAADAAPAGSRAGDGRETRGDVGGRARPRGGAAGAEGRIRR